MKEYDRDPNHPHSRAKFLKASLNLFNLNILQKRNQIETTSLISLFFKGLILPFDEIKTNDNDDKDEDLYIITRFLDKHSFCFSTKARVPTKISVECIRLKECYKWDKLYISEEEGNNEIDYKRYINISSSNVDNVNKEQEELFSSFLDHKENKNEDIANYYENIKTMINEKKIDLDDVTPMVNRITIYQRKINEGISGKKDYNKNSSNENPDTTTKIIFSEEPKETINKQVRFTSKKEQNIDLKNSEISTTTKTLATKSLKSPFGKDISIVEGEIKSKSPYRNFKTYKIFHFIAKADDDLRQEQLVMQMIKKFKTIFDDVAIPLWIRPYHIEVTSASSGILEFLPNTNSIDAIKKQLQEGWNLNDFYREHFKDNFDEAQINFTQSLAAYSLICYILQIKDRHNGNILIDKDGHIIHIDFGFLLGISPGNLNFESAPFKLTNEYLQIMEEEYFEYFKLLILRGFLELKKHVDYLVNIVQIMSYNSKMPCFNSKESNEIVISKLRERFHLNKSENELKNLINDLVLKSKNNFWTNRYDNYQYMTNGIKY